jgi:hypothetical protein
MGEEALTATVKRWLKQSYRKYDIDANCHHYNDIDVIVYEKGKKRRVLQVEVKGNDNQNQYIGIAEAMDYNRSDDSQGAPTFLAVPIDAGGGEWRTWELARDIYRHYKTKIGILAIDGQTVKIMYNPRHAKLPK